MSILAERLKSLISVANTKVIFGKVGNNVIVELLVT